MRRHPTIGLVVPDLGHGGGVSAVARFIKDVIVRSGRYDLRVVSLSTAARDPSSVSLFSPSTWVRGVGVASGTWEMLPYTSVGAVGGELEFQRYRPRAALTRVLAECDLIQVVCGSPAWANAVVGLGKPVALQVATRARVERRRRDADPLGPLGWWRKAMTEVTDHMDDRALRRVDAIQVENLWMRDYARKLNAGRPVDIRYAPPGVDSALFCPLPTRDWFHDPYVLCVARLDEPRKNIGLLLEAYAGLPGPVRAQVRMVLAGSSAPPALFWQRAAALGLRDRITYAPCPDPAALVSLYQRAAVFALPSDEEGFGVALVEAMACGVPVISTRSGGPNSIVTEGRDGFLIDLDSATSMSDRILRLLHDRTLNLRMGIEARRTTEARFAEAIAGDAFIETWDSLLVKAGKL